MATRRCTSSCRVVALEGFALLQSQCTQVTQSSRVPIALHCIGFRLMLGGAHAQSTDAVARRARDPL